LAFAADAGAFAALGSEDVGVAGVGVAPAVAYALRAMGSTDAQDVVWAARQLYDAADYIVQREAPNQTYIEDLEQQAPIQLVLRGFGSALEDLDSASLTQSLFNNLIRQRP
jgi:hypothetical protein